MTAIEFFCVIKVFMIYFFVIHALEYETVLTHRGDWGTLRRKNSHPPNIDLIFEVKHFEDTYGYIIQ